MKTENQQRVIDELAHRVGMSRSKLDELTTALQGDSPLYALSWGNEAIAAAATIEILSHVLKELAGGAGLQFLRMRAREAIMRGARYPEQSTSPMHNLTAIAKLTAWAEFIEATEWAVQT